jgi:hypothetical protein
MYSKVLSKTPKEEDNFQFEDYYIVNNNWMDDQTIDVMQILRTTYEAFFIDNQPDYKKLKEQITLNDHKAKELFKSLFRISHVLGPKNISTDVSNILKTISMLYGKKIYAHGVEEAKGGMYNLLMMAISNRIRVPSSYWGYFKDGPPNISPLAHGPYYVIYTTNAKNMRPPNMPTLAEVEYILVPFSKNIQILKEYAATLVKFEVLDETLCELFCSKLIDYENFLSILNQSLDKEKGNYYPPQFLFSPLQEKRVKQPVGSEKRNRYNSFKVEDSSVPKRKLEQISPTKPQSNKVARKLNLG